MKFIGSQLGYFFQSKNTRRNIRLLLKFLVTLVVLVTVYSIVFHYIMASEGKYYSWITGFYWTLTVMSTLGFGDITFNGDLGKVFSIIVLLSGVVFLLILLPFTFIQFFFAPWIEAEMKSRTPRELPATTRGHAIISGYNIMTAALIERLRGHRKDYTLLVEDLQRALELYDIGLSVSLGNIDDPETYRLLRAPAAAVVVAANSDEMNTNIAFTVREISEKVPVICTAESPDSVDILTMAGANMVLQLSTLLGQALARRTMGGDTRANVIGVFDELMISEAPVMGTPIAGKTLSQIRLREIAGVSAIGVWDRGSFIMPGPDTLITPTTVLVLAGSLEQMNRFEELMFIYQPSAEPVIIIGAGRVGVSVAESFKDRNINHLIVEKDRMNCHTGQDVQDVIEGNAADIRVLEKAGISKAPAVILTTNDDATNIYLTKYCRSLRSDIQLISRASADRNVSTLHRAGADFVMSYSSLGVNAIFNYLENDSIVMLAEGLDILKIPTPGPLAGKTLAQSRIRQETACTVVAVKNGENIDINPDPHTVLQKGGEIIVMGSIDAEKRFIRRYAE